MASGWLAFHRRTTPFAFLAAAALVVLGALAAKGLVERFTALSYEIHWTTMVPLLVALVTLVLNFELNARRRRTEARSGEGGRDA